MSCPLLSLGQSCPSCRPTLTQNCNMRASIISASFIIFSNALALLTNSPRKLGECRGGSQRCLWAADCHGRPCYRCCCCFCEDFDGGEVCSVTWYWLGDCSCIGFAPDSQAILSPVNQQCSCPH
ncbi:hypothetical protein BKA60DRAFT_582773 [Fusarium oxysporum]|nr:hypothetical protein BKA60DRAFT_582773 [Fusarium oxysporum]